MFGAAKLTDANLKILVIDESPDRAEILLSGLRDAGYTRVEHLREMMNLLPRIAAIEPDVILIDLENPNRDTVEQMFRVSREVKRPIAMFIDESDSETTIAAVKAGVSAYIIDGLRRRRIKPLSIGAVIVQKSLTVLAAGSMPKASSLSANRSIAPKPS